MKTSLFSIYLLSSSLMIRAAILDDSMPPGNNYDKAAFRFWYPDDYKTIKGVFVFMPGSNGDGRDWVYDESWLPSLKFAVAWQAFGKNKPF